MAIYAYGEPEGNQKFIYNSLVNQKISRYLYSWFDNCDLNRLQDSAERRTKDERTAWDYGKRLLDFRPGDWVLHKNVPRYGQVTAARLSGEYFYQAQLPAPYNAGRHCFHVDRVFEFTRNSKNVNGIIYARLIKQGSLRQIQYEKEFYESLIALGYELDDLDRKRLAELNVDAGTTPEHFERELKFVFDAMAEVIQRYHPKKTLKNFLKNFYREMQSVKGDEERELNTIFEDLASVIQRHYPGKRLESFLADVYLKIPGVTEVEKNGLRGGTDHGADLIVISPDDIVVVQVKSFSGEVKDTTCVDQLETAIKYYKGKGYRITRGEVVTTGLSTPTLEKAVKNLADKMRKEVVEIKLMTGSDFAKFVLEFYSKVLFQF